MDAIKQAYELSKEKKQHAITIYKRAVSELVHKDYVMGADAFVELSAIFGEYWVMTQRGSGKFWLDKALFAEANTAFNYANLNLGIQGGIVDLAKSLVATEERIDNKTLKQISKQMNYKLTRTTADSFE